VDQTHLDSAWQQGEFQLGIDKLISHLGLSVINTGCPESRQTCPWIYSKPDRTECL